jgi:hypothetical protein
MEITWPGIASRKTAVDRGRVTGMAGIFHRAGRLHALTGHRGAFPVRRHGIPWQALTSTSISTSAEASGSASDTTNHFGLFGICSEAFPEHRKRRKAPFKTGRIPGRSYSEQFRTDETYFLALRCMMSPT